MQGVPQYVVLSVRHQHYQYCIKKQTCSHTNSFCTTWHLCMHVAFNVVVVVNLTFSTEKSSLLMETLSE